MGCHENITFNKWPKQGDWLYEAVSVCFHYDTTKTVDGRICRDDKEEPFETIIRLEDGRFVRAAECQYSIIPARPEKVEGA